MPLWVCGSVGPWRKNYAAQAVCAAWRAAGCLASLQARLKTYGLSQFQTSVFAVGTARRCTVEKSVHQLGVFWSLCCRKMVLIVESYLHLIKNRDMQLAACERAGRQPSKSVFGFTARTTCRRFGRATVRTTLTTSQTAIAPAWWCKPSMRPWKACLRTNRSGGPCCA